MMCKIILFSLPRSRALLVYVFGLGSEVISEVVICLNARSERDATDFFFNSLIPVFLLKFG